MPSAVTTRIEPSSAAGGVGADSWKAGTPSAMDTLICSRLRTDCPIPRIFSTFRRDSS